MPSAERTLRAEVVVLRHTDWGEADYSILERTSARPTLDINGIWGGYTQPGAKTVLPSKAYAKISTRLAPEQDPVEITDLMSRHLKAIAPPTVSVEVRDLHCGRGAIIPVDSPAMQAAARAYHESYGVEPIFVREGGSIPVVATLKEELGIDSIDVLEMVIMIEKDYGLRIDNRELGEKVFASLSTLAAYISENSPRLHA